MRPLRALAVAMLVGGIALIAYGVYTGEASVGIFLIFPFVMGTGVFSVVGVLLIIGAAFVFIYDLSKAFGADGGSWQFVGFGDEEEGKEEEEEETERGKGRGQGRRTAKKGGGGGGGGRIKGGGIVFIGPVPVVFGADKKWTEYMMILAILLVVALCAVFFVLAM